MDGIEEFGMLGGYVVEEFLRDARADFWGREVTNDGAEGLYRFVCVWINTEEPPTRHTGITINRTENKSRTTKTPEIRRKRNAYSAEEKAIGRVGKMAAVSMAVRI